MALLLGLAAFMQPVPAIADRPNFDVIPLTLDRGDGTPVTLEVEIASTPFQHQYGLMFVTTLADNQGMLFVFPKAAMRSFWMKNTLIPLDMLFIRTDGTIAFIGADSVPYSREPVSAGVPVAAVLEIGGGRAAELGIKEGDVVQWGGCAVPTEKLRTELNFCPG